MDIARPFSTQEAIDLMDRINCMAANREWKKLDAFVESQLITWPEAFITIRAAYPFRDRLERWDEKVIRCAETLITVGKNPSQLLYGLRDWS